MACLELGFLGLIAFIAKTYIKNDKELDPEFKQQYFRDFPDESSPEEVQLLMSNKLDALGLSSSLLNIIRKKGLIFNEVMTTTGLIVKKDKKDYNLTLNDQNLKEPLTEEEVHLRTWLLSDYGDGNTFLLSDLKKKIKNETSATEFMNKYNIWKNKCKINSTQGIIMKTLHLVNLC